MCSRTTKSNQCHRSHSCFPITLKRDLVISVTIRYEASSFHAASLQMLCQYDFSQYEKLYSFFFKKKLSFIKMKRTNTFIAADMPSPYYKLHYDQALNLTSSLWPESSPINILKSFCSFWVSTTYTSDHGQFLSSQHAKIVVPLH